MFTDYLESNQIPYNTTDDGKITVLSDLDVYGFEGNIPPNTTVKGNLYVMGYLGDSLPSNLTIEGHLSSKGEPTKIKTVGNNLIVFSWVSLTRSLLSKIGDNAFIGGELRVIGVSTLKALPEKSIIVGDLNAKQTGIKSIPQSTIIFGQAVGVKNNPKCRYEIEGLTIEMVRTDSDCVYFKTPNGNACYSRTQAEFVRCYKRSESAEILASKIIEQSEILRTPLYSWQR